MAFSLFGLSLPFGWGQPSSTSSSSVNGASSSYGGYGNGQGVLTPQANPQTTPQTAAANSIGAPLPWDPGSNPLTTAAQPSGYTGVSNVGSGQGGVGGTAGTGTTNSAGGAANFTANGGTFQQALGNLQNTYNGLFGDNGVYPQAVGQAAANVMQGYGAQQGNLQSQFSQSQAQLPWEYAARGANSSGWGENAFNAAQSQFNNSTNALNAAEQKDLAGLYQQEAGTKNQYNAQLQAFQDPTFQAMLNNAPSYIQSEQYGNLLNDLANMQYTQGANTPITQALQGLQQNPTYQDQGAGILQSQLQALQGSGAPIAVQNMIAQGIMGNQANPYGQGYWQNYWKQLQDQSATPQLQPTAGV